MPKQFIFLDRNRLFAYILNRQLNCPKIENRAVFGTRPPTNQYKKVRAAAGGCGRRRRPRAAAFINCAPMTPMVARGAKIARREGGAFGRFSGDGFSPKTMVDGKKEAGKPSVPFFPNLETFPKFRPSTAGRIVSCPGWFH